MSTRLVEGVVLYISMWRLYAHYTRTTLHYITVSYRVRDLWLLRTRTIPKPNTSQCRIYESHILESIKCTTPFPTSLPCYHVTYPLPNHRLPKVCVISETLVYRKTVTDSPAWIIWHNRAQSRFQICRLRILVVHWTVHQLNGNNLNQRSS